MTKVRNEKQDVVEKPPRSAHPPMYTREAVEDFLATFVRQHENELLEALAREHYQELLERIMHRRDGKNSSAA